MPAAVTKIIEQTNRPEIQYIITFVSLDNVPSLKGIHRSGFMPYVLRTDTWFLFRRKVDFGEIPEALMLDFFKKISRSS